MNGGIAGQQVKFLTPLSEDEEQDIRPEASWQIGTIEVDNPTGRWMLIQPLAVYVPPFTIGWKKEFRPTAISFVLRWAAAPPGGSVNVDAPGDQVILTMHSDFLGEDNGLTYKIATDTDNIILAIRSLRRGWGDLALEQDIHIAGPAGSVILADTGNPVVVSYATVRQDGVIWNGGGLQAFMGFTLSFAGGPGPNISCVLAYPDMTEAAFLFPPRFFGLGDLNSSVNEGGVPSPIQNSWTIDVWYREIII